MTTGGGGSGGAVNGNGGQASGGSADKGGSPGNGGSFATGGTTGSGTAATGGGLGGSGGTVTSGSGGTVTSMGGTGGVKTGSGGAGSIPAGFPMPTAANYSMCQKVPMSGGTCPGGGNGPVCIECLFGGPTPINAFAPTAQATSEAGNYLITVTLGGAAAGDTFVSAEMNRGLLSTVTTAAGKSVEYAFAVDVRARESEPTESGVNAGYPGLDLFFSGTNPEVSAIGYAVATTATRPVNIFIASDSTACDQSTSAYAGWGQMLPEFFGPAVEISNYADSGESSVSFYGSSGLWGAVKANWKAGDWVLIQFGHNDKSATDAQVETNLEKYVTDAQAAGVNAILVSPPARVGNWNGNVLAGQSLHAASAMGAAAAKKVPYIDLTALSTAWYNSLGSKAAALKYHALGTDATHTNLAGAAMLASIVANAIKTQNLGPASYLRGAVSAPTGTGGASGGGGGTGGSGGQNGAGGAASPALTQACADSCAKQTALACVDSNCQSDCLATAAIVTPGSSSTCQTQFMALLGCEGTLAPADWTCSSDENEPEPVTGQCTSTVCAWACCVSSLNTTSDIWTRCESLCN